MVYMIWKTFLTLAKYSCFPHQVETDEYLAEYSPYHIDHLLNKHIIDADHKSELWLI